MTLENARRLSEELVRLERRRNEHRITVMHNSNELYEFPLTFHNRRNN